MFLAKTRKKFVQPDHLERPSHLHPSIAMTAGSPSDKEIQPSTMLQEMPG